MATRDKNGKALAPGDTVTAYDGNNYNISKVGPFALMASTGRNLRARSSVYVSSGAIPAVTGNAFVDATNE